MDQGKTILIVDDNLQLAVELKESLRRSGFNVLLADTNDYLKTVDNVKDTLGKNQVNLVILDLQISGVNGIDLYKDVISPMSIPAILMTGSISADDLEDMQAVGLKHYLVKPFRISSFINLVNRVLNAAAIG